MHLVVRSGSTWSEQQDLGAPNGSHGFGSAIGLSGDTLVVGVALDHDYHGAAYVFVRSGKAWTLQQELAPCDGHGFSRAVSVEGDTLMVGADGSGSYDDCADAPFCHPGAVYVFRRLGSTWSEQLRFSPSDSRNPDGFCFGVPVRPSA